MSSGSTFYGTLFLRGGGGFFSGGAEWFNLSSPSLLSRVFRYNERFGQTKLPPCGPQYPVGSNKEFGNGQESHSGRLGFADAPPISENRPVVAVAAPR